MELYPVWEPAHYYNGLKAGLTYTQMLDNINDRARQLAEFFRRAITGRVWDIDELAEEARALKAYHIAFVGWLLDPKTSPLFDASAPKILPSLTPSEEQVIADTVDFS